MKHVCLGLLVSVGLFVPPSPAAAQLPIGGTIAGIVSDVSDAVVPGATVQLTDDATKIHQETTTNESGYFSFPGLSFGSYQVTVTLSGFQRKQGGGLE